MEETKSLSLLSNATKMLAEVKTIDDAKQLMNTASAAKLYAQKQKLGKEAVDYAREIELRAEIKLGEILSQMEMNKGAAEKGANAVSQVDRVDEPCTLAEIGISKNLSSDSQTLAKLTVEEQEKVVTGKKSKKKAIRQVRQKIRDEQLEKKEIKPLQGKYKIIYADPPWCYGDKRDGRSTGAEDHYPSMTIFELCNMPVKDMAEDDAVLFLWVTSPLLEECFEVIRAWGFKYKTSFIWDKVKHNMGHYNSVRHEFLLICTRGSCLPDNVKLYDSVLTIERSDKHSEKPEEFRKIIDDIYTAGRRIELFSRKTTLGWDCWGNEV